MSPSLWTSVLLGILSAGPVFAGSRAWESAIAYTPLGHIDLPDTHFGTENSTLKRSTGSAHSLKKRFVTINPGTGSADDRLWPDATISYCFESAATKELFFEDLVEARKLWESSGLGSDFKWTEKSESLPNFLLIVKSDGLSCTTGVPPINKLAVDPENRGPLMRLMEDLTLGKKNVVANFAHQMGHAWGLHHEHQNPAFWSSDYAAANGKIFSSSNFKCANLPDYAATRQKFVTEQANGGASATEQMEKACTSRAFAKVHRFSAAEYLPFTDSTMYRASPGADPDWDSIMIYGTGSAVLTKPNGESIKQNLAPSQQDVDGLKKLYKISPSSKFDPLGSNSNSKKSVFNNIRKKERDSGCGEVPDDDPVGDVPCGKTTCSGGSCPVKKSRRSLKSVSDASRTPKRVVPTTPHPLYGFLNRPAKDGLDDFATEFFGASPIQVDLGEDDTSNADSSAIFVKFENSALFAGMKGLSGCTSVILTSRCGAYISHHWEMPNFTGTDSAADDRFNEAVIIPLTTGYPNNDKMVGISQLPQGCFNAANNLQVTILTGSFRSSPGVKRSARVDQIKAHVALLLDIEESVIRIQTYDANSEDGANTDSASGKVLLTYNPNIFPDQTRQAAYEVWAGAIWNSAGIKPLNKDINEPLTDMAEVWVRPASKKKRDIWSHANHLRRRV